MDSMDIVSISFVHYVHPVYVCGTLYKLMHGKGQAEISHSR